MNLNLEKLDQIEDELMKLGSPREIVPLLGLIIGKYAAIGAEELHIPLDIEEHNEKSSHSRARGHSFCQANKSIMSSIIRLRFEFHKKSDGSLKLEGYRPFPADVLPAIMLMAAGFIVELDIPEDNKYKIVARHVLTELS